MRHNKRLLLQDLGTIGLSIGVAVYLAHTNYIPRLLAMTDGIELIGSFLAGTFFSSMFTTPTAVVALAGISQAGSPFATAAFGALGAVVADLVIFRFIKNRFSDHLMELARQEGWQRRLKSFMRSPIMRKSSLVLGGLIMASPLPDELAIGMMGLSHVSNAAFIMTSLMCNFSGILLIGLAARTIL